VPPRCGCSRHHDGVRRAAEVLRSRLSGRDVAQRCAQPDGGGRVGQPDQPWSLHCSARRPLRLVDASASRGLGILRAVDASRRSRRLPAQPVVLLDRQRGRRPTSDPTSCSCSLPPLIIGGDGVHRFIRRHRPGHRRGMRLAMPARRTVIADRPRSNDAQCEIRSRCCGHHAGARSWSGEWAG
jgi:hypothetical protein